MNHLEGLQGSKSNLGGWRWGGTTQATPKMVYDQAPASLYYRTEGESASGSSVGYPRGYPPPMSTLPELGHQRWPG